MKLILVVGARPNFMKVSPLIQEIERYNTGNAINAKNAIDALLVHTGQHYDYEMDKIFFEHLELPEPHFYLGVGSGSHAEQTAKVMLEFEKVLEKERPDMVVVVGDVNSTLACALATAKFRCALSINHHLPVTNHPLPLIAHVEAGLRSFDRLMPEEINRQLTDAVSDLLFTPSPDADENLKNEGIPPERIYQVGDIMVDSLLANREKAERSDILHRLGVSRSSGNEMNQINMKDQIDPYAVLTLHRPSNVDNRESLKRIINALEVIGQRLPIIYPVHPRARKNIEKFGFSWCFNYWNGKPITGNGIYLLEPLGYLDFLCLQMYARLVMTDSGGIQEETTVLNIPCLTLRDTTERPITITEGTNILVGNDTERIIEEAFKVLNGKAKLGKVYELWDGRTAGRIVKVIVEGIMKVKMKIRG